LSGVGSGEWCPSLADYVVWGSISGVTGITFLTFFGFKTPGRQKNAYFCPVRCGKMTYLYENDVMKKCGWQKWGVPERKLGESGSYVAA